MIEFIWPWMSLALPLPLLVWRLLPQSRRRQASLKIPHYEQFLRHESLSALSARSWLVLAAAAWILLIAAAARPVWIDSPNRIQVTGRDMVVAVDASGSMEQTVTLAAGGAGTLVVRRFGDDGSEEIIEPDVSLEQAADTEKPLRIDKFQHVQNVGTEFILGREGDRVGLIIFGTQAFLHAPLTFDTGTVAEFLRQTRVGFAGTDTAIGDTIALGVKVLRERPESNRILVLLTDGEQTYGNVTVSEAANLAKLAGVRVYAIRIGEVYDTEAQNLLIEIAKFTNGAYFYADSIAALDRIYEKIDEFEPVLADEDNLLIHREIYAVPLGLAIVVALLMLLMRYGLNFRQSGGPEVGAERDAVSG